MVLSPPKPPNGSCLKCYENIIPGEDDCPVGGKHLIWAGDNTGLLAEFQEAIDDHRN